VYRGRNLRCSDFDTQQQAQAIFELDLILFGDTLDSDVIDTTNTDPENLMSPKRVSALTRKGKRPGSRLQK
jgi:hypothetical protein